MKYRSSDGTIKRILGYVKKYRVSAAASILFALINVAGGLYVPILVGRAIDCIVYG